MHPLNIIKKLRIGPLPKESLDYEWTSPLIRTLKLGEGFEVGTSSNNTMVVGLIPSD